MSQILDILSVDLLPLTLIFALLWVATIALLTIHLQHQSYLKLIHYLLSEVNSNISNQLNELKRDLDKMKQDLENGDESNAI